MIIATDEDNEDNILLDLGYSDPVQIVDNHKTMGSHRGHHRRPLHMRCWCRRAHICGICRWTYAVVDQRCELDKIRGVCWDLGNNWHCGTGPSSVGDPLRRVEYC